MSTAESTARGTESTDERSNKDTVALDMPVDVPPGLITRREGPVLTRGSTLGRYVVLERLGSGAMGVVYAAYDNKLDRKVALKVLRSTNEAYEARLMREAQAMARLSHPNVVAVYDAGHEHGQLFIAMEFAPGTTLRAWQRAAPRSWRQTLAMYVDAGRGLAAAHEARLVHRDFKPENVLVSEQRVRVTDFGIARAVGDVTTGGQARAIARALRPSAPPPPGEGAPELLPTLPGPSPTGVSQDQPLTEMGSLMGTPAYMAPEQWLCEDVDARADQFAFCVALYEGLYGHRPFGELGGLELAAAVVEGRVEAAPKPTQVPSHLRRVLLRGLARSPAQRYPSMQALLDDLQRDPARARRRAAAIAAFSAALLGTALWTTSTAHARRVQLCSGAQAEASEVWNGDTRSRIEGAMLATGVPYASDSFVRTREALDHYMQRWAAMHTEACAATRIQGHQPETVMALRMACLEERRNEVRALTSVLASVDRDAVAKAVPAAFALAPVEACRDVTSLTSVAPEPTDPGRRTELEAIRSELAVAKAKLDAGRYGAARDQVAPLVARAQQFGYRPLTARVLTLSGEALFLTGAPRVSYLEQVAAAVLEADMGRDEDARAMAANSLVAWTADGGDVGAAERWSEVAQAAIDRLGNPDLQRARWLTGRANLSMRKGDAEGQRRWSEEGLQVARRTPDALLQADSERKLAQALAQLGRFEEADRDIAEADATVVRVLGPEHPQHVAFLVDRGYIAGLAGDNRRALGYSLDTIALLERIAPDGQPIAVAYTNTCLDMSARDDDESAYPYCEKAIEKSLLAYGPNGGVLAYAYANASAVLLKLHHPTQARADAEHAVRILSAGADVPGQVAALGTLGSAQMALADSRDAVSTLERALELASHQQHGSSEFEGDVAGVQFHLAQALWQSGVRTARAASLALASAGTLRRVDPKSRMLAEIDSWIAARRPGGQPGAAPTHPW